MSEVGASAVELPPDALLTAEQVAPTFKLHVRTVQDMARRGELPGVVYFGRALRFKRALVVAWLSRDEPAGRRRR